MKSTKAVYDCAHIQPYFRFLSSMAEEMYRLLNCLILSKSTFSSDSDLYWMMHRDKTSVVSSSRTLAENPWSPVPSAEDRMNARSAWDKGNLEVG